MTGLFPRTATVTLCLLLGWPCVAQNQAALITNADIIRLIQAGLPESAIINKIQANPGAFDTSTDALIALKKAGATDAELAVITAAPPAPAPAPMPVMMAPAAPAPPVELFGGQLLRTRAGDPYIQFPAAKQDVFPDGRLTNTASLVIYQGEPAILIPSIYNNGWFGNLLFLKSRSVFNRYLTSDEFNDLTALDMDKKAKGPDAFALPVKLPLIFGGSGKIIAFPSNEKYSKWKNLPSELYIIGNMYGDALSRSAELQLFFEGMQNNFDTVIAQFEQAAGITDPQTQLSPHAHYQNVTDELAQRYKVLRKQRVAEEKAKQGSKSWLATLNQVNDAVSLGSGVKSMGAGLANGSGTQMAAGLQTTTASANAMAATGTQAQYAANAQMQASLAQSNTAAAQAAAGSQYAAATPAASGTGGSTPVANTTTTFGNALAAAGQSKPVSAQAPQPATTVTYNITLGGLRTAHITSSPPGINCPGACSYTWSSNLTQHLFLTVDPGGPGLMDNMQCTGTAPHTPGKTTTCDMGALAGGTINLQVCNWKQVTPYTQSPCAP